MLQNYQHQADVENPDPSNFPLVTEANDSP